jgi:hypothetical protein
MARKSAASKGLAREAYPSCILFEELAGIYWLRGRDLARVRDTLSIRSDAESIGFDKATMLAHGRRLNQKRIKVGVLKDMTVRTLQFHRPRKPVNIPSTTIGLAPELLLGRRELERLQSCLTRKHSPLKDLTLRIRADLSNGHHSSVSDFGRLYVYEAWEGAYEVDFELTTMSKTTFEALALVTHQTGKKLLCHLARLGGSNQACSRFRGRKGIFRLQLGVCHHFTPPQSNIGLTPETGSLEPVSERCQVEESRLVLSGR